MKINLANKSMIDELSHMLKNEVGMACLTEENNSPFIICWLQFFKTALPMLVMTVHTMQQKLIKQPII